MAINHNIHRCVSHNLPSQTHFKYITFTFRLLADENAAQESAYCVSDNYGSM